MVSAILHEAEYEADPREWLRFRHAEIRQRGHVNAAREFGKTFIRSLALHLPLEDITHVLSAERLRERGLSAARGGDMKTAERLIAAAAVEASCLDGIAALSAGTFQHAAKAYLHYQKSEVGRSLEHTRSAIDMCTPLMEEHGFDLEFRRVHLVRNHHRVEARLLGTDVVEKTALLLRYVTDVSCDFPLDETSEPAQRSLLGLDAQACAVDEILTNLFYLGPDQLVRCRSAFACLEGALGGLAKRWVDALVDIASESVIALRRDHAAAFCVANAGLLPMAEAHLLEQALD